MLVVEESQTANVAEWRLRREAKSQVVDVAAKRSAATFWYWDCSCSLIATPKKNEKEQDLHVGYEQKRNT